jgi:nitroreductase
MIESESQKIVDLAIASRRSIRAFLPTPVPREDIERMLEVAARAPSGSNTQPWKAYVLTGARLKNMSDEVYAASMDEKRQEEFIEPYRYYPDIWESPDIDRRRKVGFGLYNLLGLGKNDKEGMKLQHGRNFRFFDAPVGMVFTVDKTMNKGSWLDFGCFLQNIMVAARGRELDTCPQAALNRYHSILRKHAEISERELVICCLALGYADHSKIENTLVSEREPVSGFAKFLD